MFDFGHKIRCRIIDCQEFRIHNNSTKTFQLPYINYINNVYIFDIVRFIKNMLYNMFYR